MFGVIMYKEIENYGIIGNLNTVALVANDGSIDFMCWPDFDSPTLFAALLDEKKGGFFKIAPIWKQRVTKQMYLPDTNILFTRFLSDNGVAEIADYMPMGKPDHKQMLIRRLKTIKGEIKYRLCCEPKFNYGLSRHKISLIKEGLLFESDDAAKSKVLLRTDLPLKIKNDGAYAEFTLKAGQVNHFIFEDYDSSASAVSAEKYVEGLLESTISFWRQWIKRCTYQGRWREMVHRSALILKLLTSQKHGSIIASPTFGLPEVIGGAKELGLSLHLDQGHFFHIKCAHAPWFYRREYGLYAMD